MVYSTVCSSEFSERGWVKQQKWTFFNFYTKFNSFSCASKCIFVNAYFFHRDGRLCDIKILSFKFSEASGWVFYMHAYYTACFVAHGMLMVHNGILATGKWNQSLRSWCICQDFHLHLNNGSRGSRGKQNLCFLHAFFLSTNWRLKHCCHCSVAQNNQSRKDCSVYKVLNNLGIMYR